MLDSRGNTSFSGSTPSYRLLHRSVNGSGVGHAYSGSRSHSRTRCLSSVRESISIPTVFPRARVRPELQFLVGQQGGKETQLLLIRGVSEVIAGVEDAEVVDVLDVSLAEIKTYVESICEGVESVEGFGLGLVPCEGSPSVLNDDSLFILVGRRQMMEKSTFVIGVLWVAETVRNFSTAFQRSRIDSRTGQY